MECSRLSKREHLGHSASVGLSSNASRCWQERAGECCIHARYGNDGPLSSLRVLLPTDWLDDLSLSFKP
jgi:hypothetical protein